MPPNLSILEQLTQFQERDLFSVTAWQARGLNASDSMLSRELTVFFHRCAKQLEAAVSAGQPTRRIKTILTSALSQLNKTHFDTEEREFIVDTFQELAAIVGVDIRQRLNIWLYGLFLITLMTIVRFLRPERVVEVLRHPCTQCGASLETRVLRKKAGIPERSWLVARCNQCGELNLLSMGPDIAEIRFGDYQWVDSLSREEYTYEQALVRMQQIKFFRK